MAISCGTEKGCQGFNEVEVSYALSTPFSISVDTTTASIQWGISTCGVYLWAALIEYIAVAALLFPHIAKKIQEELDAAVGRSRLPTFQDEETLPYLVAFIKECLRLVCVPIVSYLGFDDATDIGLSYQLASLTLLRRRIGSAGMKFLLEPPCTPISS